MALSGAKRRRSSCFTHPETLNDHLLQGLNALASHSRYGDRGWDRFIFLVCRVQHPWRATREVDFVKHADQRLRIVAGVEHGLFWLSIVNDFDNNIGGIYRRLRPFDSLLLYGIGCGTDACRIGELDCYALDRNGLLDDIARGARNVGNDSHCLIC